MSDFKWLKRYPEGIPAQIEELKHNSLVELFEESFKNFGDREAFSNMGKTLTYKEIDELSTNFAAYLQKECGLKKGDTLAIQMPNCLQYPIVLIGGLKAGLKIVNTNPLYMPREMEHQFKDAEAKAIVIVENFASNLEKVIGHTQIKNVIQTKVLNFLFC